MKFIHLKKRHKIIAGIIIFIAILLFAAPRIVSWYIVKHSFELTGRNIEINKLRFNYFTGTLRIQDLKLYEQDSKNIFLSFKKLKANLDYLPFLKDEIFVKYISIDDPYVQVLQDGARFNFSDLTATDSTSVEKDTVPGQPTKYILNNIRIARGYVKYTDVPLNHTIALNNLDLVIPGFIWNSDSTDLNVDFRFVDGGGLISRLALNQADSTYTIKLKLDSLNLDVIEPYMQSNMNITALHGYLSNDLLIKGSMQSILKLFVQGVNHIYGFQLIDTLKRTIFSFNDLMVDIDTFQLDRNRIKLKDVNLTDPVIIFELTDSANNWLALMKPLAEEDKDSLSQKADTISRSEAGSYTFRKLLISGGKVQFTDKTLRYPFDYIIDKLRIESSEIAGMPGKLNLLISAGLNNTGTFNANATINPSDLNDLDLALSIGQFRMKDVDAYFKHYFGFPVTGGIMNFKTENKLRPASLVSNNSLYFRKFTLAGSMRNKPEYNIPLRLALGVLSDKNGIIDLKAPVESKGDEVKVKNLGKIIFRVIGNLFVKAAVSPINLLSGDYKVDPAALQEIRFGLTEPSPDRKNLESLDIIADILNKKPGLNIDFFYCIDSTKAIDSLAYIMSLNDFIKNSKVNNLNTKNIPDSTLISYLLSKSSMSAFQGNSGLRFLCRNFAGERKIIAGLDSIKSLQTAFLMNYLSRDKQVPANRFRIIGILPDTIKPSANYPSFRTYFTTPVENQISELQ